MLPLAQRLHAYFNLFATRPHIRVLDLATRPAGPHPRLATLPPDLAELHAHADGLSFCWAFTDEPRGQDPEEYPPGALGGRFNLPPLGRDSIAWTSAPASVYGAAASS